MNQSCAMLQYRLLEGPVGLEPLRILASRREEWQGWTVTFYVLGASHAVRWEREGSVLTELLACALPEGDPGILAERKGDRPAALCLITQGLRYQMRLTPFALPEGDQLRNAYTAENRLEVAYPTHPDGITPYTRIGWRLTDTELSLETIHTYPEEGRGVHSATVITPDCYRDQGLGRV
jgi:hypothetical protein